PVAGSPIAGRDGGTGGAPTCVRGRQGDGLAAPGPRERGPTSQPEELARDAPLLWSPGKGTEVWALFQACIAGDLPAVEWLVRGNPALVRAHYQYRRPIYFAVRENQFAVAAWLLERQATDGDLAVLGPLLEVA